MRTPTYGKFVAGNAISLIGSWMQRMAVGWLAWTLTGSAFWLGVIAFADLFPTVLIGPIGGTIADRFDRLRIIKFTEFLACIQSLVLFSLTMFGSVDIVGLVILSVILGTIMALNQPSRLALIPSLVGSSDLNTAIGLNSVIINLARFIGPAIAGVIIATMNIAWVFAFNFVTFVIFLIILLGITLSDSKQITISSKRFRSDLVDGLIYAARDPQISTFLYLMIAVSLGARPLIELLPGFAGAVFDGGATTLAILTSAFGLGAVSGGLWLAGRNGVYNLTTIVTVSAFTVGLALLGFSLISSIWVAIPVILLVGATTVISGAGIQTLIQTHVKVEMRGRVMAIYGLIMRGGPAIGALSMGIIAEELGLRWSISLGAILVIFAAIKIRLF